MQKEYWKDYFEGKDQELVKEWCGVAERMIEEFCINYDYDGEPPKIFISSEFGFRASATDKNEIIISHDYLNWIEKIYNARPEQLTPDISKKNSGTLLFQWLVAHEFTHIARAHFFIRKQVENCAEAYEYDADKFGTAGVYRFVSNFIFRQSADIKPIQIKKFVLLGVFFYLREFIEDHEIEYNKIHMPFHVRLVWLIEKLAWIDNYDPSSLQPHDEFNIEIKEFMDLIQDAEKIFLTYRGLKDSKLRSYLSNLQTIAMPQINIVREKWNTIEPLVRKYQKITDQVGIPNPNKTQSSAP